MSQDRELENYSLIGECSTDKAFFIALYLTTIQYSKSRDRNSITPGLDGSPTQKKTINLVAGKDINNQVSGYPMWDSIISLGRVSGLQVLYEARTHTSIGRVLYSSPLLGGKLCSNLKQTKERISKGCGCQ